MEWKNWILFMGIFCLIEVQLMFSIITLIVMPPAKSILGSQAVKKQAGAGFGHWTVVCNPELNETSPSREEETEAQREAVPCWWRHTASFRMLVSRLSRQDFLNSPSVHSLHIFSPRTYFVQQLCQGWWTILTCAVLTYLCAYPQAGFSSHPARSQLIPASKHWSTHCMQVPIPPPACTVIMSTSQLGYLSESGLGMTSIMSLQHFQMAPWGKAREGMCSFYTKCC